MTLTPHESDPRHSRSRLQEVAAVVNAVLGSWRHTLRLCVILMALTPPALITLVVITLVRG